MSEYEDTDVYLYGNMVTDSVATWKIPPEKVELVQRLPTAKGRFADIYEAILTMKNGKRKVVAKILKREFYCELIFTNVSHHVLLKYSLIHSFTHSLIHSHTLSLTHSPRTTWHC